MFFHYSVKMMSSITRELLFQKSFLLESVYVTCFCKQNNTKKLPCSLEIIISGVTWIFRVTAKLLNSHFTVSFKCTDNPNDCHI